MERIKKNIEELRREILAYGEKELCGSYMEYIIKCWETMKALQEVCGGEDAAEHADRTGSTDDQLTNEQIMRWVASMENADGTHGAHWTMELTEQARKQKSIDCDPVQFYAAMNMMYSDYCKAAEKANCSSVDLYAYMAKAFLDDKDAKPDKLARYYHFIAEK